MALSKVAESSWNKVLKPITESIPATLKETVLLRAFGFLKIPLLFFISPTVVEITDNLSVVKIRLNRRTRNHLNSMYFGVLAAGADCAGGLAAMRQIHHEGNQVNLIFKDFHADFLKRAEGDVLFSCDQGSAIRDLVRKAMTSGERENMPVQVIATVPSKLGQEPVAKFTLTLSLKRKKA